MQTMKWIEMVRLGPPSPERSSTFDSDKVRSHSLVTVPFNILSVSSSLMNGSLYVLIGAPNFFIPRGRDKCLKPSNYNLNYQTCSKISHIQCMALESANYTKTLKRLATVNLHFIFKYMLMRNSANAYCQYSCMSNNIKVFEYSKGYLIISAPETPCEHICFITIIITQKFL